MDGIPNIQDKIIQISTTHSAHAIRGVIHGLSSNGYLYELREDKNGLRWEFLCESPNLVKDKKVEGL